MKIKTFSIFVSVLAMTAVIGGCSSRKSQPTESIVQTHQDDDITRVGARMQQRTNGNRMGSIRFNETESGLQMTVDLRNTRPNTEYRLWVYDLGGCTIKEFKQDKDSANCEKQKMNVRLPAIQSDADGNIQSTFMLTGVSAAELDNSKLTMTRPDANGNKTKVSWGWLKQRRIFFK